MSAEFEQLLSAWRDAADDLGINVATGDDVVLVTQFGSSEGMLCALADSREDQLQLQGRAEARGARWSALSKSYLKYDRDLFIATLDDWGWSAEGDAPDWYTGEPWSP
jgi:hypothetical protein